MAWFSITSEFSYTQITVLKRSRSFSLPFTKEAKKRFLQIHQEPRTISDQVKMESFLLESFFHTQKNVDHT